MTDEAKPPRTTLRWLHRHYRVVTVVLNTLLTLIAVGGLGADGLFDGTFFDAGVAVRSVLLPGFARPSTSTAVIAMDWPSLRSSRTASMPRALFAPIWGPLLDELAAAGAKAVVFDFIFEFSGNNFVANYDRPFLASLARHQKQVVLARTAEVGPAMPFLAAAGGRTDPRSIALSELETADDGVVRLVHPSFPDDHGGRHPTLSGAALLRAGAGLPDRPIRYLPTGALEDTIPTWSLNDVLGCVEDADGRAKLADMFGGRVVFLGSILPEEDRKTASDRMVLLHGPARAEPAETVASAGCRLKPLGRSSPLSGTVPGVHLHAAGAAAVLDGTLLRDAPLVLVAVFAATFAALATLASLSFRPAWAALSIGGLMGAGMVLSWAAPPFGLWLPVGHAEAASLGAMGWSHVVRYLAEERRRRRLQALFGRYLSPQVVAQMTEAEAEPKLGGQTRVITCMFADLSGFTALSGRLSPSDLLDVTNRFLACIVRAVDETGGYVDKFIGDAVMAIWNAPADLPAHAVGAVDAACRAAEAIRREAASARAAGEPAFSVKIGINSGAAVVGNVGALRRYNYTAIGATVNIASRLEPLPAIYGCDIVLSDSTVARLDGAWVVCELDWVKVKGRDEPLVVFTPVAPGQQVAACADFLATWNRALAAYRAARFAEAAALWNGLSAPPTWPTAVFGPSVVMAERAAGLDRSPPVQWSGIWDIPKG